MNFWIAARGGCIAESLNLIRLTRPLAPGQKALSIPLSQFNP
jgi:hypothetical protein